MKNQSESPMDLKEWLSKELQTIKEAIHKRREASDLMTKKGTAEYLSVNLSTIHNWVKAGILKPTYLGGRVYFRREDILEALNTQGGSHD